MFQLAVGLYLIAVGLLCVLAYRLYHNRWLRRERSRTTMGVMLVFIPGAVLAIGGIIDPLTVAVLFAGFGVAGAVTVYQDIQNATRGASDIREQIINDASN